MRHIVQFSFGEASWYTAKMVAARYGTADLILLFADTKSEDEDTYRWGRAAAANVGGRLVEIADGRDIWQLFKDERMIGNTRADVCSRVLKRELCDDWIRARYGPDECILYVGIGLFEKERLYPIQSRNKPYIVRSPLAEEYPYPDPVMIRRAAIEAGLGTQRLYELGFRHANCGGACVKGGHGQWSHLLSTMPERYAYHEAKEAEMREMLGKDVAILRDRRGGTTRAMSLKVFRERQEAGEQADMFDWAACSCFANTEGVEA